MSQFFLFWCNSQIREFTSASILRFAKNLTENLDYIRFSSWLKCYIFPSKFCCFFFGSFGTLKHFSFGLKPCSCLKTVKKHCWFHWCIHHDFCCFRLRIFKKRSFFSWYTVNTKKELIYRFCLKNRAFSKVVSIPKTSFLLKRLMTRSGTELK